MRAFALTHEGKVRAWNEDASLATFLTASSTHVDERCGMQGNASSRGVLLGAFDGKGGGSAGAAASALVMQTILEAMRKEWGNLDLDAARSLDLAMKDAARVLFQKATTDIRCKGMGCTATVATLADQTLVVAQIGDTRAYVLRDQKLVQVTRDHSLLNDYEGTSFTADEIAVFHPTVVTRALGGAADVCADLVRVDLHRGDVILLCSDGLWSVVEQTVMRDLLLEHREPEAACRALLATVLDAGAPDNVAIVVAYIDGGDLPPPGTAPVRVVAAPAATLSPRSDRIAVRRTSADAGTMAVHDAAELPDGKLLVALGELGVWLLSREGRVLVRFAEPAQRLVMSDHGDRAILVAFRGEALRMARLDLLERRVRFWCDARIDHFASEFDGATWYVSRGGCMVAIDALSDRWEHLWKTDEAGAVVSAFERDAQALSVCFERKGERAVWTFELPAHTLRQRRPIPEGSSVEHVAISPAGQLAGWTADESALPTASVLVGGVWHELALSSAVQVPPQVTDKWVAFTDDAPEGTTVHVYDASSRKERAVVQLEGSRSARVRFQGDRLLVADDRGRILCFCLTRDLVVRDWRV
jgi:serine/threonine protein phosphatase PrpC